MPTTSVPQVMGVGHGWMSPSLDGLLVLVFLAMGVLAITTEGGEQGLKAGGTTGSWLLLGGEQALDPRLQVLDLAGGAGDSDVAVSIAVGEDGGAGDHSAQYNDD